MEAEQSMGRARLHDTVAAAGLHQRFGERLPQAVGRGNLFLNVHLQASLLTHVLCPLHFAPNSPLLAGPSGACRVTYHFVSGYSGSSNALQCLKHAPSFEIRIHVSYTRPLLLRFQFILYPKHAASFGDSGSTYI